MKQNKGFSLIELIVVIAIIAVLASVAALSVGSLAANDARSGAANINAAVSRVRTMCMGRQGEVKLVLEKDADTGKIMGHFYENGVIIDTRELCSSRVTVSCNSSPIATAPQPLRTISFKRATGELDLPAGNYDLGNPPYCLIKVFGPGNNYYAVQIYRDTGSHSVLSGED